MAALLTINVGCQSSLRRQEVVNRVPQMPIELSRDQIVAQLNDQNRGLNGWRSTSTQMHLKLPRMLDQDLSGYIACQAPNYFHLTAENLIAKADVGSNASGCWAYTSPGPKAVMTWNHEDTELVQTLPSEVPFIDPNWLMLVLGITPLDPHDYELSRDRQDASELWLTAIENSPSGRPLRRIIKVNAMAGVIQEHAIYDSEGRVTVQALLSRYQNHGGHKIPSRVKLAFPQQKKELTLTFRNVETNPTLPDQLWHPPEMKTVDLGDVARHRMLVDSGQLNGRGSRPGSVRRAHLQPPVFHVEAQTAMVEQDIDEPDWDSPHEATPVSFEQPKAPEPKPRRSWTNWFGR